MNAAETKYKWEFLEVNLRKAIMCQCWLPLEVGIEWRTGRISKCSMNIEYKGSCKGTGQEGWLLWNACCQEILSEDLQPGLRHRANLALRGGSSAPTQLRTVWRQARHGQVNPRGHGWRRRWRAERGFMSSQMIFLISFLPSPTGISTGNTSFNLGFVKILLKIIKIFKALREVSQRANSLNGDQCNMKLWEVEILAGKP